MSEELRNEQQFLLASLRDLEREREAGDIDDNDYATLREGYIARTAAITRELDGTGEPEPTAPSRWKRRVLVVVAVASFTATIVQEMRPQALQVFLPGRHGQWSVVVFNGTAYVLLVSPATLFC